MTTFGEAVMIGDMPSDEGISAMVDIAGASGKPLNPRQRSELDGLVALGLIKKLAPAGPAEPARYALTSKGQKVLDDRGVGANES
jgi:hypothetical protein